LVEEWQKDVKMTLMKTLPKMEISDELDWQIKESIRISDLCKTEVVRQALRIGLPQLAARFQPAPSGWRNAFVRLSPNMPRW